MTAVIVALLLSQLPADAPVTETAPAIEEPRMNRSLFEREHARLLEQRPSLAPSIVFWALAFGHFGPALYALIAGARGGWEGPDGIALSIGTIVMAQSLALSVVAYTELMRRLRERKEIDEQLAELPLRASPRPEAVTTPAHGDSRDERHRWFQLSAGVAIDTTASFEGTLLAGVRLPWSRRWAFAMDLRSNFGSSPVVYSFGGGLTPVMTAQRFASAGVGFGPRLALKPGGSDSLHLDSIHLTAGAIALADFVGAPKPLPDAMIAVTDTSTRAGAALGAFATLAYGRAMGARFSLLVELDYVIGVHLWQERPVKELRFTFLKYESPVSPPLMRHQFGLRVGVRL